MRIGTSDDQDETLESVFKPLDTSKSSERVKFIVKSDKKGRDWNLLKIKLKFIMRKLNFNKIIRQAFSCKSGISIELMPQALERLFRLNPLEAELMMDYFNAKALKFVTITDIDYLVSTAEIPDLAKIRAEKAGRLNPNKKLKEVIPSHFYLDPFQYNVQCSVQKIATLDVVFSRKRPTVKILMQFNMNKHSVIFTVFDTNETFFWLIEGSKITMLKQLKVEQIFEIDKTKHKVKVKERAKSCIQRA